jgi:hypothetical protein
MSEAPLDDLRLYTIPKTDDPRLVAQRAKVAKWFVDASPEAREELVREGRVADARSNLRDILSVRGLALSADDEARIDASKDLDTLRRWMKQAVVAATVAEALR